MLNKSMVDQSPYQILERHFLDLRRRRVYKTLFIDFLFDVFIFRFRFRIRRHDRQPHRIVSEVEPVLRHRIHDYDQQ